jgi:hypothetical protein
MTSATQSEPRKGLAPDPQRFFIPIELDRTRVLCFDNRATFRIYQRYGAAFWLELFEADPAQKHLAEKNRPLRLKSLDAFEFFLWAGLQRDADEAGEVLNIEGISEYILPMTIDDLCKALLVALSATRKAAEKPKRGNVENDGAAAAPVVQ